MRTDPKKLLLKSKLGREYEKLLAFTILRKKGYEMAGECGIDAFLVDVYPFQLFVDKGNGGFQFSLFFLRQLVVARSLR